MSRLIEFAPVRLGVAGLGRSGMFHVERIGLRDDCQVVAAYDDCPAARNRAKLPAGVCHASWSEFLRNDQIELVLLAAPPAVHAELAIAALAAGKHVLIETPMCLNLAEADALIAASARTGRSVSVAHLRRWDDDFRTAQAILAAGELGPVREIKLINWQYNPRRNNGHANGAQASIGQLAAGRAGPNSDQTFDRASDDWRDAAATGGGVLWEFGIHYFDQLLQLAGSAVESVYARFTPAIPALPGEDMFLAIIAFSGGSVAHVEVSRTAPVPLSTGWMIAGASGSYAGFTQYSPNPDGEVVDLPLSAHSQAVTSQADEFYAQLVRHIRFGEPNPVAAEQARGPIALIEAARKSAHSGQVVTLNDPRMVLIR